MTNEVLGNYLRAHRRRCGLSQRELGILVGYADGDAVGLHELSKSAPPLLIALAYEIVFDMPVGKLFVGFRSVVERSVARNFQELQTDVTTRRRGQRQPTLEKQQWLATQSFG